MESGGLRRSCARHGRAKWLGAAFAAPSESHDAMIFHFFCKSAGESCVQFADQITLGNVIGKIYLRYLFVLLNSPMHRAITSHR